MPRSGDIEAALKYSTVGDGQAVFHASTGGEGENDAQGQFENISVRISNGRDRADSFSLDQTGFTLVQHESAVSDFYDRGQLRDIYEAEAGELVQSMTGASRTVVFDHTIRTDSEVVRKSRQVRDAVPLVHNDYTDRSARQRVRDILPAKEVDALLSRRFAIVNIWRSIGGIVDTTPLAICDARSISESNLIAMERRAGDRIGEMQQATFDPNHRWYYFARMAPNEALVFKTFDSSQDGPARRSLHSAFENTSAATDAPPRESIETRVFAFF
ncbi:MAG: CmcJ/NvfI family oxidoreductase [Novosphingobium sp.]|nr:CmcJ/NvfI family oxidoreductase [Novosphingobium sp.]